MYRSPLLTLCAVLITSLAIHAAATTTVRLTDLDLATGAELILIGDALEVTTTWVDRDLVTLVTVEVDEVVKGEVGDTVDVALPGGVDVTGPVPVAVTWPGAPTLAPGERAVLFLESYGPVGGTYAISGWSQGKFAVGKSADGEAVVFQDLSGITLSSPTQESASGPGGSKNPRTESLDAFVARIRALLADAETVR